MRVSELRGKELVALAMYRLGASGPTELADRLGLTERRAPEKIGRWLAGTNEPSFPVTLLLLEHARLLRENGEVQDLLPDLQAAIEAEARRLARAGAKIEDELVPSRQRSGQSEQPSERPARSAQGHRRQ